MSNAQLMILCGFILIAHSASMAQWACASIIIIAGVLLRIKESV